MEEMNMNIDILDAYLEKHTKTHMMLDEVAHAICHEEEIGVFHLTYELLNADREKGKEVFGVYTYTECEEYQERVNRSLSLIEELEAKYSQPYEEFCEHMEHETEFTRADFVLPRITLCNSLIEFGHLEYYATFFHEIGHHFAVKEKGSDHDELDADRHARQILLHRLPEHYHKYVDSYFRFRHKNYH